MPSAQGGSSRRSSAGAGRASSSQARSKNDIGLSVLQSTHLGAFYKGRRSSYSGLALRDLQPASPLHSASASNNEKEPIVADPKRDQPQREMPKNPQDPKQRRDQENERKDRQNPQPERHETGNKPNPQTR